MESVSKLDSLEKSSSLHKVIHKTIKYIVDSLTDLSHSPISNLDLYTVYYFLPDEPPTEGEIQYIVGKAGPGSGFQHDSGELPPSYGSQRCQHDVWKNRLNTPGRYVGFQEYRRRFKDIPALDFDIGIFPKISCQPYDLGGQFTQCHGVEAWKLLLSALAEITNSQIGTTVNWVVPWDCIITKPLFIELMEFWWPLCKWIEPRLSIPQEGYQTRMMSFLADRIFVIWLVRKISQYPGLIVREIQQTFLPHGFGGYNRATAV